MAVIEPGRKSLADWRREMARRGFECAAGAALHGAPPERYGARDQARAFYWGGLLPALIVIATITLASTADALGANAVVGVSAVLVFGLTIYALKIAAMAMGAEAPVGVSWPYGFFSTIGYFPEFAGVLRYWFGAAAAPGKKGPAAR
jgi:hypothetical protein